jgi:hypothetical protein
MPMIRHFIAHAFVFAAACAHVSENPDAPMLLEFSQRGDDGLTQKISEAILSHLLSSGEFVLDSVESSQVVRLEVNGHAIWRQDGDRVDATVGLKLHRADGLAAGTTVRCYEDQVEVCGRAALEFVRRIAEQDWRKS